MKTENFSLASATDTVVFDNLVRVIRYDEGSGTGTPKIRIKSLSGGAFDVEMVPGRQIRLAETVRGLVITNLTAAPITGKITIGAGDISDNSLLGTITLDAATLAALESVDLNASTLSTLNTYRNPITPNGFWTDDGNVVGGSSKTIFTAAANVNGAIVLKADITSYFAGSRREAFIKKSGGLPSTITDGGIVLMGKVIEVPSDVMIEGDLQHPQFIEPGFSLSYISTASITANSYSQRSCIYKLL